MCPSAVLLGHWLLGCLQVLLMDADSMPLIDPAILFDVPTFK
jgi:hypothetical protein